MCNKTSTSFITKDSRNKRILGIAGAVLTLAIPFFMMLGNTDHHLDSAQSLCPFKMLTGFPCPGCGITKSIVYFYEGDLRKSLQYHILGPFAVLGSIFVIGMLSAELITGKRYFRGLMYSSKLAYGLGLSLFLYHLVRLFFFVKAHSLDEIARESIWR